MVSLSLLSLLSFAFAFSSSLAQSQDNPFVIDVPVNTSVETNGMRWSWQAHRVSGWLAQQLLSPAGVKWVENTIPEYKGDLSQASTWADEIRPNPMWSWTGPLHFINTPDWRCDFDSSRDCGDDVCVSGAISNYTTRIMNGNKESFNLLFIIHFIGDIHQPLHVGFTSDKGGNTLRGSFLNNGNKNLHGIWDFDIVDEELKRKYGGSVNRWRESLLSRIKGEWSDKVLKWKQCSSSPSPSPTPTPTPSHKTSSGFVSESILEKLNKVVFGVSDVKNSAICPEVWASESISWSCSHVYVLEDGKTKIENGFSLSEKYFERALPVVEERVAQAGVRLAAVIEELAN